MTFSIEKGNVLRRLDKSQKGSIDAPILRLVDSINAHPDYVTTSSCSGRIVLMETGEAWKKTESTWLFVSHDPVQTLPATSSAESIWFRYEGAILHVKCKDTSCAKKLVDICRNSGFKRTGIMSIGTFPTIELTSSESIVTPLQFRGDRIIAPEHLQTLLTLANGMMLRNHAKLDELSRAITKTLGPSP